MKKSLPQYQLTNTGNTQSTHAVNTHTQAVTTRTHTQAVTTRTRTHVPPRLEPSLYFHGELRLSLWRADAPPGAQREPLAAGRGNGTVQV